MLNLRIIGTLVIAAGLFFGGWTVNGWRKDAQISELRAQHQEAVAVAEAKTREMVEKFRATEQQWQERVNDANTKLLTEQSKNRANIASFSRERSGLRDALTYYADHAGGSEATIQTCRADTARIGGVLAETLQREEILTGEIESLAADTRSLYYGWPQ